MFSEIVLGHILLGFQAFFELSIPLYNIGHNTLQER